MKASELVTIDPEILGGTPVFKGTRVPTKTLFDYLADGLSLDYFLELSRQSRASWQWGSCGIASANSSTLPPRENPPRRMRTRAGASCVPGTHAVTVQEQGWTGIKNGALLEAAESAEFALFIVADKNLRHQQNLAGRRLAILEILTNHRPTLENHFGAIRAAAG